ncbi:hypothetical protein AF335_01280 [Streptomyces eurocidicus]|uniref:Uncharacterized protein n=1 Tax=Streptomyces eurocidicus TaxID=66423 RepID=A0A2N8P226_STREU|nr:hypothetical protein [Streptomyces eurocidicus]MBB5118644.1 hypothetical protein [Streptomyces eurocidicus]MBF6052094.1 hypothetical protein [Streptomyces eurocidicus]PNE35069.1 hypothetical protein AF335_01280 [Streptomyces eurocidicus]
MTYKSRTTSDRKPRGNWLGVTLGWIWALGTLAADSSLAAIVGHDLTHRVDGGVAVSRPEGH